MADKDFVVKNSLVVNTDFSVNSTAVYIGNSASNATVNSTVYTGSANNTAYVGLVSAANVVSNNQLQGNLALYVNTTGSYTMTNTLTFTANIQIKNANLVINASSGIIANNQIGVAGQALLSNGSSVYWASVNSSVITAAGSDTQIQFNDTNTLAASAGLKFNKTSNTITIGNTGTNATVNSTIYTGTSNNTLFVSTVSAANVVSNAQLTDNLARYVTQVGFQANLSVALPLNAAAVNALSYQTGIGIAGPGVGGAFINTSVIAIGNSIVNAAMNSTFYTATANNTSFVGTVSAANVVSNSQLSGNLSLYVSSAGLNANLVSLGYVNTAAAATITGTCTHNANLTIGTTAGIIANGGIGSAGQVLSSNGSSAYWQTVSTVGGSNTYVQFNDSGFSNGSASLVFTKTNNTLTLLGPISGNTATFTGNTTIGGGSLSGKLTVYTVSGDATDLLYMQRASTGTFRVRAPSSALISIGTPLGDNLAIETNGTERARFTTGFSVGTTADPGTGAIYATGNITAYYSDERLKVRKGNIDNALSKVQALNGFYYEANELAQSLGYKAIPEVGVSAQEVQAVLPEIVVPAPIDDKYLTVRYEKLVPLLIEAIKELKAEVDALKNRD
jgi:hypothetical protein